MMRYSVISRDLSSDSLRYAEQSGDEYIYQNLRDESPPSDVCNQSGTTNNLQQSSNNNNSISTSATAVAAATGPGYSSSTTPRKKKECLSIVNGCFARSKERDCEEHSNSTKPVTIHAKNSRRKNSIGSSCLTAMSSSPGSPGGYYNYGSTPPAKTQSLPPNASIKNYDAIIMNALRVTAEELANQITLLDFPVFANIQPDELTSCAWTKKDKHIMTPNIVAFTKRFNHTSFWTVQEILSGETPKQRGEILTHFIKVAKKLFELNNLHSLFAIVSAMQTASIYRLKKTWTCLSKKDKQTFDRLADVFSDHNNWENLRQYLESLRLPCIPYLGLFLTDLIYIDLAHPHLGGLEPEQRRNKMNNILRVISNYQQSDYNYVPPIEKTQKYLQSIRYIEELQNIFEEDQYKKSVKLEPPLVPSSSSCSSKESFNIDAPGLACLNLSPAKTVGSVRISGSNGNRFIQGHRKCRSLGSNIFGKASTVNHDNIATDANEASALANQPRHLLDDSVIEDGNSCQTADATSTESSEGVLCHRDGDAVGTTPCEALSFQGCVRRKTFLKEGRKPAVASWQRYWLQIWANSLVYFPPKSFKGSERSDFKREPCKVCSLNDWCAQVIENPKHKNSFELLNHAVGTVYKFRTDCPRTTHQWVNSICKAAQGNVEKPTISVNLMSFE